VKEAIFNLDKIDKIGKTHWHVQANIKKKCILSFYDSKVENTQKMLVDLEDNL